MKLNNIGNLRSANLVLILAALTSNLALAGGGPTGGGPTGTVTCSVIRNFTLVSRQPVPAFNSNTGCSDLRPAAASALSNVTSVVPMVWLAASR